MKQEYFEIGQIVNHFGIKGMVKVNPFTDDMMRFEELEDLYIQYKGNLKKVKIEQVRYQKNQVLLKLEGINSIEEAENYRNCYLKIHRKDARNLEEDMYFIADLIGLEVYTNQNELLGKLDDVFSTGSNDVYVVKDQNGKQILLPAIKEVIKQIDLKNKKITVELINGLL